MVTAGNGRIAFIKAALGILFLCRPTKSSTALEYYRDEDCRSLPPSLLLLRHCFPVQAFLLSISLSLAVL